MLSSFDSLHYFADLEQQQRGLLQPSSGQPNEGQGSRDRIRGGREALEEKG